MSIATYPYAASPADPAKVIPLLPLLPPPTSQRSLITRLPARPDRQPLPGYTLTRHTFPGAYPRTAPGFISYENNFKETDDPLGNVYSSNKNERAKLIDQAINKVIEVYTEAGARTAKDIEKSEIDEPVVRLAVNRFVRNDFSTSTSDDAGVTLIVCHANGFHKEMWEETLREFLAHNSKPGGTQIAVDEIWALDFANQGESFRLNGGRIGPVASWADCHCLPDVGATIPEALEYSTNNTTRNRKLIGIGHSIGGNTISQAAHAVPGLFENLFLVDPMTRPIDMVIDAKYGPTLAKISVGRRNVWESRTQARRDLLRSPYFQAWHPTIFDVLISHGLVNVDPSPSIDTEDPNVPVTLACPRWAEAAVFTDWHGIQAGYDKLPFLDKNMKVRFVMAGDPSATGGEERTRLIVWRPPTTENIILTEASHLVTQEKPGILGEQLWRSLLNLPLGPPNVEKQIKAKL
ncbi:hypothetical protein QFC22_001852 [Naganishia vaughanmartiniae]|uniref:Uncharacterized protein n=1 Tax=Naganishia vaughanmartiniae TaxID=1424756 RepID=A0ACC2XGN5_9TREE|nr:hypothetical protein QFC22_001852 [Naganishia vaughanmartiniae]